MKSYRMMLIVLTFAYAGLTGQSFAQNRWAFVTDSVGKPISGVTAINRDSGVQSRTDAAGRVAISATPHRLSLSHIAYVDWEGAISGGVDTVRIKLDAVLQSLEEVEVFSTGYAAVSKERATGSFSQIGQDVLEKRVTTNILENIEGMAPGLQFDRRSSGEPNINIRGINTLSLDLMGPLIIVDNFPYSGDINSINPLDIESVTLLKDAAAASIWGARAGNGVIVIKTKKSMANRLRVDAQANLRLSTKEDLFYHPAMSSSDFIDVERMLFEQGMYTPLLQGNQSRQIVFSPVVDLLWRQQNGEISSSELEERITTFRGKDYREDVMKHMLRKPFLQQYQFSISGGGEWINQRMSLGYTGEIAGRQGNSNDRFNLTWNTQMRPTDRLTISTNVLYTYTNAVSGGTTGYPFSAGGTRSALYPYAQLIDADGMSLSIPRQYNYNYVDTVSHPGMRDWKYRPLDEIDLSNTDRSSQALNANLSLRYAFNTDLSVEGLYNIELNTVKSHLVQSEQSFYVRNLFNRFGYLQNEEFLSPIPDGGILDASYADLLAHRARMQITYGKKIGFGDLSLFGGSEISNQVNNSLSTRYFGYNHLMIFQPVNLLQSYPVFDGLGAGSTIPDVSSMGQQTRRFVSFYANGSYDLGGRYVLSGSVRRDASNMFGVRTNERWNPLWSTGVLWNIDREKFVERINMIERLQLKATLGHSGNTGGVASTLPVIEYMTVPPAALYKMKRAMVNTLPNEHLRWENVRMINLALQFELFNGRINGSFDYFFKHSSDLLSNDPLDPTSGFSSMIRNVAEVRGRGFDMAVTTKNLNRQTVRWQSTLLFSKAVSHVTAFFGNTSNTLLYTAHAGRNLNPLEDRMLYPVLSYRFEGLDPQEGNPQGWHDGQISTDYAKLLNDSLHNVNYHGTALPVYHGSLQNTFSYKNLNLWINLAFKFGHFFQRETIGYNTLYNTWVGHSDFERRWQHPGDEHHTTVPSMQYPANSNRDDFYAYSEANIDRGDLLRLQDVRLSYGLPLRGSSKPMQLDVFVIASNLGLLWKSTDSRIDPDFLLNPVPRTYSLGLKLSL